MVSPPLYSNILNRRIAVATVIVGIVSMVVIGIPKGMISAQNARRQLVESLENSIRAYTPALESTLLAGETAVLQMQIEGLAALAYTSYAAILVDGKPLVEEGNENPKMLLEHPLYRPDGTGEIGRLIIHWDEKYLQGIRWGWIYRDLPFKGIGIALLGIFLFFYVDRLVTGRIRRDTERIGDYNIKTPGSLFNTGSTNTSSSLDEIDLMEAGFDRLSVALQKSFAKQEIEQTLAHKNFRRYQDLFDYSPIPLMLVDYSAVYQDMTAEFPNLDRGELAKRMGAPGWRIRKYVELMSVIDTNKAMLDLVDARDMDGVLNRMENIITEEAESLFREHLVALALGQTRHFCEGIIGTLGGGHRHVQAHYLTLNYESDLPAGNVLIAFVDVTTGKHMEGELAEKVREREVLIRELFHRTKNNMQSILSFISLESWRIGNEALRTVLHRLESRIYSMSLVHRMLYEYSDLSRLSLSAYLREYAAYLNASENLEDKGIRMDLQLEELEVTIDIAVPIGLIVTELVNNAIEHGFSGRTHGVIHITLEGMDQGDVILTITDDGVGVRGDFDPESMDSLGLQLVGSIVESQLGGTVSYTCGPEGGFSCRVIARPSLYEARV